MAVWLTRVHAVELSGHHCEGTVCLSALTCPHGSVSSETTQREFPPGFPAFSYDTGIEDFEAKAAASPPLRQLGRESTNQMQT